MTYCFSLCYFSKEQAKVPYIIDLFLQTLIFKLNPIKIWTSKYCYFSNSERSSKRIENWPLHCKVCSIFTPVRLNMVHCANLFDMQWFIFWQVKTKLYQTDFLFWWKEGIILFFKCITTPFLTALSVQFQKENKMHYNHRSWAFFIVQFLFCIWIALCETSIIHFLLLTTS